MKHVILGAGPAGVIAAETIRKQAPDDQITIVGDEPEAPYSRMAIPYLLIGQIGEEGTHLRHTAGHYDALRIALHANQRQRFRKGRQAHRFVMLRVIEIRTAIEHQLILSAHQIQIHDR